MKISKVGLDLIKKFEGCSLKAYRCPAGVWTIGWGTTETINGVKPHDGMVITQAQADEILIKHLEVYERAVNKLPLENQNQFDALVSFCYNLGAGIFTGNLLDSIKRKQWQDVARQILLYNKAGGKELAGLTRRREAERELFLKKVEEVEQVEKIKIEINGKVKSVNAVNVDGTNFIKLRDLEEVINVGYNEKNKMPTVKSRG